MYVSMADSSLHLIDVMKLFVVFIYNFNNTYWRVCLSPQMLHLLQLLLPRGLRLFLVGRVSGNTFFFIPLLKQGYGKLSFTTMFTLSNAAIFIEKHCLRLNVLYVNRLFFHNTLYYYGSDKIGFSIRLNTFTTLVMKLNNILSYHTVSR